ncbi:hypothetical protein F4801DRAFT_585885 [Xylaria longipes]|nr:hypothetical protein F4801DRAFT_585885 [Xylaria longipes]
MSDVIGSEPNWSPFEGLFNTSSKDVTIPGAENLSPAEMTAVRNRALQLRSSTPLDVNTLLSKLRLFLFERDRQIRLETWTEYQNYHFMYHEELEQKREGQKERLVKLREIAAESTESLSDIKFALAFQPGNVERSIQRVENHQLLPLRCPPPGMPPPRCAPSGGPRHTTAEPVEQAVPHCLAVPGSRRRFRRSELPKSKSHLYIKSDAFPSRSGRLLRCCKVGSKLNDEYSLYRQSFLGVEPHNRDPYGGDEGARQVKCSAS